MSRLDWFHQARYGMFIHWGPYSVAGRGEWVANREAIPFEEYRDQLAGRWKAERYDPRAWAQLALDAGMKYVVLTTRHHDGFCLWDSDTTEFKSTRIGPMRDLIGPYVSALRDAGLKVGFYFSVADWYHPDYPDAYARDWPTAWPDDSARKRFVAHYQSQLVELMTRYGPIDLLWYDGCIPQPLDGGAINQRIYELQPNILINERLGEPFDFKCSEQTLKEKQGPWEACMTLNDNWGYHAGDHHWKGPVDVVRMLVTTCGKGGNLLLNVGPRADGVIPEESARILREAGAWLKRNGAFLPGSDRIAFPWSNCGSFTARGNTLYLHLFASPGSAYWVVDVANEIRSAKLLDGGRPLSIEKVGARWRISGLPEIVDPIATTIALELDGPPRAAKPQQTFWVPQ